MNEYDVIVVGIGAMGSATCCELARRGVRVLGLEQFEIPNTRGSSHGFSRMIRMCYYEHHDYVPLLKRAYELWHALEEQTNRKLLHITGGVYIGGAGNELVSGSLESARKHGLQHELLDHAELRRRYPQFQLPENYSGLYEPMAGWLAPEKCIAAFVELALRSGAEIHAHEPVERWSADDSGVEVQTGRNTYRAEKLLICGGPWSGRLLADLNIELTVTRQVLMWVWPKKPELFGAERMTVWAIGHEDETLHYGFPMSDDGVGFKLAHHAAGTKTEPDRVNREPQPDDQRSVREFIKKYLPDADGPTLAQRICMYTNTRDKNFVVDRHPQLKRVTFACGFSGHGFKFASVIGEVLADLALEGRASLPVGFLSLRPNLRPQSSD